MALIGPHVNRDHAAGERPGMAEHVEAARLAAEQSGLAIKAISLFVGGPHNRKITLRPAERAELQGYLAQTGLRAIAHSSYAAAPWKGDPDAARFIREEADVCQEAGIEGLVVHLPKLPVENVMRYIARLFSATAPGVRVYLEIPAIPKGSFYETPEKLAELFQRIRAELDRDLRAFGLCIDTAHLWTCGVDISSYEEANDWLARLERLSEVIPPRCVMIHCNDSLKPRGVGPDAHAGLARGKIWEAYKDRLEESGLAAFTDYAQRHEIPVILERKTNEALLDDYYVLRELVASARA